MRRPGITPLWCIKCGGRFGECSCKQQIATKISDYTIQQLADRLGVCYESAARWVRGGKVFAEKRKNQWMIPRADGDLFISEYLKRGRVRGRALSVVIPESPRADMKIQKRTRATTDQTVNIWMPLELIHAIDEERRARDGKVSRSAIVAEALKAHLQLD